MKRQKKMLALGLSGLAAATLSVVGVVPAGADYAPQAGDVVGLGGDTPQYALTFIANGDTLGDAGINSAGAYNRLVTFNATADANGRSAYANGSTEAHPLPLNPTDVLRAGTYPVQRNQSSGTAIKAILADTGATPEINFVFSASLPTSAQQTQAQTQGWGGLHVVRIGTDSVQIATADTTNAPNNLTINELLTIYEGNVTKWNQLPGNSGGSGDTIIPEIPPASSSINKTLIASLTTANGGTAPTLGGNVITVEQNDPNAVTGASSPADAIVPFSAARLNLYNSGYFHNPNTVFPGGTVLDAGIKFNTGASAYDSPVTDYVIFRQSDLASTTPFQPGSSINWAQRLFSSTTSTPYVASGAGQALINASGVTANYADLGLAHS
ncbi:MAG TPA: substrate-binding domain-containing protein [Acidimicrobiales bacterium]|nr:substrate-binding domain-containing protein [Acidimicrobiales bacterium]